MVRFNFKKVAASVAALSVVACMAAVPTSASDTAVELTIGQIEVPVSQAKKNAVIDVPIKIDAPDLTGFTIYIDVEDSATGGKVKRELEFTNAGLKMTAQIKAPETASATAAAWAAGSKVSLDDEDTEDNFAVVHVTLLEDLAVGDQIDIQYMSESATGMKCEWKDTPTAYEATAVNGWIKVVEDEVSTTTTPAATTTTPAATTTTPAGQGGTTTTPPAGEGESTTTTPAGGAAGDDGTTTTPAGGNANGSDTTPASGAGAGGTGTTTAAGGNTSTSSPQTGSSDVLPIAGAAAAVAVLGGVALVAKKKND